MWTLMMKKLASSFIFLCSVISVPATCYESRDSALQQSLQIFYDKCVKTGLFCDPSLHRHHIAFARLAQTVDDSFAVLKLIEWLEQQQDENSKVLLDTINELCYLKFVQLMSYFECGEHALAIEKLQYLAHKEVSIEGGVKRPFRTTLSKIFLAITLVNAKKLKPEQRKEFLALALEKIENDMLKINRGLGEDKVQEHEIRELVAVLEVYAVRIPAAGVNVVKLTIIISVVILAIAVCGPYLERYIGRKIDQLVAFIQGHIINPPIANTTAELQRSFRIAVDELQHAEHALGDATAANLGIIPRMFLFGRWFQPARQPAAPLAPPHH
jgi:hypothetical protein